MKPYIRRDYETKPIKLKLLEEITRRRPRLEADVEPPPTAPIDYCYVSPQHIPSINALCGEFFWPGIDRKFLIQNSFRITTLCVLLLWDSTNRVQNWFLMLHVVVLVWENPITCFVLPSLKWWNYILYIVETHWIHQYVIRVWEFFCPGTNRKCLI